MPALDARSDFADDGASFRVRRDWQFATAELTPVQEAAGPLGYGIALPIAIGGFLLALVPLLAFTLASLARGLGAPFESLCNHARPGKIAFRRNRETFGMHCRAARRSVTLMLLFAAACSPEAVRTSPAAANRQMPAALRGNAQGLDGWGPLRFTMTRPEVRRSLAAQGQVWTDQSPFAGEMMRSTVTIDGQQADVVVVFRPGNGRIEHVALNVWNSMDTPRERCQSQHAAFVNRVAQNYSGFTRTEREYPPTQFMASHTVESRLSFPGGGLIMITTRYNLRPVNVPFRNSEYMHCQGQVIYAAPESAAGPAATF